jgi:hypothetical protein
MSHTDSIEVDPVIASVDKATSAPAMKYPCMAWANSRQNVISRRKFTSHRGALVTMLTAGYVLVTDTVRATNLLNYPANRTF